MSAFQQIELIKLFEFCWVVPGADSTYVDDVKIISTFKVIFFWLVLYLMKLYRS